MADQHKPQDEVKRIARHYLIQDNGVQQERDGLTGEPVSAFENIDLPTVGNPILVRVWPDCTQAQLVRSLRDLADEIERGQFVPLDRPLTEYSNPTSLPKVCAVYEHKTFSPDDGDWYDRVTEYLKNI